MNEIQVMAHCTIHPGKLQELKVLAERCLSIVRQKDKNTLQYDWFFNKDQTECVVREKYRDSGAVLQHVANLGDAMGQLLGLCEMSIEIYGEPSVELVKATASLDVTVYRHHQGL